MTLQRTLAPILPAAVISLALLLFMYNLIRLEAPTLEAEHSNAISSFTLGVEENPPLIIQPDRDALTKVQQPIVEPIDFKFELTATQEENGLVLPINEDQTSLKLVGDNQLILLMGYPPEYPSHALSRGIEGYVVVTFNVDTQGNTFDAQISESQPAGTFDRSALNAIARFKYRPLIKDGQAQIAHGQRYLFRYDLES